jgi:co-chaperonin GroES (HSP10)
MLVQPLDGSGFVEGIEVKEDSRRNRTMAYVLSTKECSEVEAGDIVFFEEGTAEMLKTSDGEQYWWLTENNVTAIDTDIWSKPREETKTAGGLILPGSF